MTNRKVDILVYAGTGSTVESIRHCIFSLRRLLSHKYAVNTVTERTILREPWTKSCALLVFPGGADTGYCKSLNGDGNRIIDQYVRRGGCYLGFCAGGYYGGSRCEFEVGNKFLEVIGSRELSFYPGICRGCAFKGFEYHSEAGAKAVQLSIPKQAFDSTMALLKFKSYYNGGGVFVDAAKYSERGVEVLARYSDPLDVDGGQGDAAVVYCEVSSGKVILTGPHPEFAAANLNTESKSPAYLEMIKVLKEDDSSRVKFLKACLTKLGLSTSHDEIPVPSLSLLHLSSMESQLVSKLLSSWKPIISTLDDGKEFIKAEKDTFCLKTQDSKWKSESDAKFLTQLKQHEDKENRPSTTNLASISSSGNIDQLDSNTIVQNLILHEAEWPNAEETPSFDHIDFYASLKAYQDEKESRAVEFGKYLMYGEVVTSTNTILEKNPKLLAQLPTGLTFTATTQVAGRGRGSNLWVSPAGSLIMSVFIKHPITVNIVAPVVFIQYIAAIAVVQGIHSYDKGFEKLPVKLKWPNDIYARDPLKQQKKDLNIDNELNSYTKIGGILVNSSYSSDGYNLVIGIGLNTNNAAPTTSLDALLLSISNKNRGTSTQSNSSSSPFFVKHSSVSREKLLARILTRFETLYKKFCHTGFDSSFHTLYYSYWLHTDQIVTLEAEDGVRARIKGITPDWGLLKVEKLSGLDDRPTGKIWNLQSDCNSFDFFKGLLKIKS